MITPYETPINEHNSPNIDNQNNLDKGNISSKYKKEKEILFQIYIIIRKIKNNFLKNACVRSI